MTRHIAIRLFNRASFAWMSSWMTIASVCLVAQLIQVSELRAQSEPAGVSEVARTPSVYLIEVPAPIIGMVDTQIKRQIDQLLSQQETSEQRPILILEFSGKADQTSQDSEFERCLSLARFLASDRLGGTRTVAFVAGNLTGHALLPVLACEELIVNPDAEIGDAGVAESFIDRTMKSSYVEISERRRTIPPAIAIGLIDQQATVLQVQTDDGVRYILQEELETLRKENRILLEKSKELAKRIANKG